MEASTPAEDAAPAPVAVVPEPVEAKVPDSIGSERTNLLLLKPLLLMNPFRLKPQLLLL